MKILVPVLVCVLAGCSTTNDPHAPKTITAGANGGAVTVNHGQRLYIPLAADRTGAFEWRRVEPAMVRVVPQSAPSEQGIMFTPVRTGTEKLRFEYRPTTGDGMAQKVVSYDVTVR
jgi:hypothetical protein